MKKAIIVKDIVHDLIDKGITSVEEIHKTISFWDKPEISKEKDVDDSQSSHIYKTIHKVNREVSELTSEFLQNIDKIHQKEKND